MVHYEKIRLIENCFTKLLGYIEIADLRKQPEIFRYITVWIAKSNKLFETKCEYGDYY